MSDGTLAVPYREKTLFFKPVKLSFSGGLRENLFAKEQRLLSDILKKPEYEHLYSQIAKRYSGYLPLKAGLFLGQLKERQDPLYREFLNACGDEKYSTFRMDESNDAGKQGVLIVVTGTEMYHVADCPDTFRAMIDGRFGRVLPEECFLTGDRTRCRINALLSNNRKETGIYIHVSLPSVDRNLITKYLQERLTTGCT
jgi:hypothetical protein